MQNIVPILVVFEQPEMGAYEIQEPPSINSQIVRSPDNEDPNMGPLFSGTPQRIQLTVLDFCELPKVNPKP